MRACPFCGSEIQHIESWAKSFDPPRLYHEWRHIDDSEDCWVVRHRGKIVGSATEKPDSQLAALNRWNSRCDVA